MERNFAGWQCKAHELLKSSACGEEIHWWYNDTLPGWHGRTEFCKTMRITYPDDVLYIYGQDLFGQGCGPEQLDILVRNAYFKHTWGGTCVVIDINQGCNLNDSFYRALFRVLSTKLTIGCGIYHLEHPPLILITSTQLSKCNDRRICLRKITDREIREYRAIRKAERSPREKAMSFGINFDIEDSSDE